MGEKVSIIIPCYNQGIYVAEAIQSALDQTYDNIEIVCVNDASTDNSREVIRKFADEHKEIIFIENPENKGVINSRNKAIAACSGEYILPLDADDIIKPTYVAKAMQVFAEKPEIGVVYCKARFFGSKNEDWDLPDFGMHILFDNCVFNSALFRKSDFMKIGQYKPYMKSGAEDWDLWLSLLEEGIRFYRLDEVLFLYRKYKSESRSDHSGEHVEDVYRNIVRHHPQLYLNSDACISKIFKMDYQPKYKKYKNLWTAFVVIAVIEFLILIFFK